MQATTRSRAEPTDVEWGVARGLAGFRWLAWAWSVAVLFVTRDDLSRPESAIAVLGATFATTTGATVASIRRHRWLFGLPVVVSEVALAGLVLVADGWVYGNEHGQTLGSTWPLAAVLMAGIVTGPVGGAGAGLVLGAGRAFGSSIAVFDEASTLALVSSAVLYTIAGAAAGAVMDRVREAESEVAEARAREAIARTLHDGVLQTLAVVQRRSADPELAALARDQELDLRSFLAGDRPTPDDLATSLRATAASIERRDGLRVEVLFVDDDHPKVSEAVVSAIAGAVGEALTNAAKHGGATRATVFVDVDREVFCSVKDNGAGFDAATVVEGLGTTTSIRGRLGDVGGQVDIASRPGTGVEVQLRSPLQPKTRRG